MANNKKRHINQLQEVPHYRKDKPRNNTNVSQKENKSLEKKVENKKDESNALLFAVAFLISIIFIGIVGTIGYLQIRNRSDDDKETTEDTNQDSNEDENSEDEADDQDESESEDDGTEEESVDKESEDQDETDEQVADDSIDEESDDGEPTTKDEENENDKATNEDNVDEDVIADNENDEEENEGSIGDEGGISTTNEENEQIAEQNETNSNIAGMANQQASAWIANDYKPGDIGGSQYEVKYGDTLWEIAEAVYGNGTMWTSILNNNFSQIGFLPSGEQALIMPGQVLIL